MAFEHTKNRYASFGVATSIPHEIIDTFWEILDNYLIEVFPLNNTLTFYLLNKNNRLAIQYFDSHHDISIVFDYDFPSDDFLPTTVNIIDEAGVETIILPYEYN